MLLKEVECTGRHPVVAVQCLPYKGQHAGHRNNLYVAALKAAANPVSADGKLTIDAGGAWYEVAARDCIISEDL